LKPRTSVEGHLGIDDLWPSDDWQYRQDVLAELRAYDLMDSAAGLLNVPDCGWVGSPMAPLIGDAYVHPSTTPLGAQTVDFLATNNDGMEFVGMCQGDYLGIHGRALANRIALLVTELYEPRNPFEHAVIAVLLRMADRGIRMKLIPFIVALQSAALHCAGRDELVRWRDRLAKDMGTRKQTFLSVARWAEEEFRLRGLFSSPTMPERFDRDTNGNPHNRMRGK